MVNSGAAAPKLGLFRIFWLLAVGFWRLAWGNWVRFANLGLGPVANWVRFVFFGFWRLTGAGWGTPPVEPGGYIGRCTPAAGNGSFWVRFA